MIFCEVLAQVTAVFPVTDRVAVKNKLRVLRAEREWSQADLAAWLGVSRQTVNAIEKGRSEPGLRLAFKISRLFSQPIETIFELEDRRS